MRRVRFGIMLGALLFVSGHAGAASDRRVEEKDKAFSVGSLFLKPGERLTLVNNDDTTHSVFIPRNELILKSQKPGESISIQFGERGFYEVRCNLHAKMKMLVVVKD
jgi:plastocyanin